LGTVVCEPPTDPCTPLHARTTMARGRPYLRQWDAAPFGVDAQRRSSIRIWLPGFSRFPELAHPLCVCQNPTHYSIRRSLQILLIRPFMEQTRIGPAAGSKKCDNRPTRHVLPWPAACNHAAAAHIRGDGHIAWLGLSFPVIAAGYSVHPHSKGGRQWFRRKRHHRRQGDGNSRRSTDCYLREESILVVATIARSPVYQNHAKRQMVQRHALRKRLRGTACRSGISSGADPG